MRSVKTNSKKQEQHALEKSLRSTRKYYRYSSSIIGLLILLSSIFTPWAFGTVHSWAINTMNIIAFAAGLLLLFRYMLRKKLDPQNRLYDIAGIEWQTHHRLEQFAQVLSFILIAYSFIYVINARILFDPSTQQLTYIDSYIHWLPHSYDRNLSWNEFLRVLALLLTFWATRDWLLDSILPRRMDVIRSPHRKGGKPMHLSGTKLSPHSKRLLVVLVINAAVLAFVGILQKLGSNDRLLWFFTPEFQLARSHFGPFVYRGNAVVYLNLAWCLGVFLVSKLIVEEFRNAGSVRFGQGSYLAIIPGLALLILASFMAGSRMGALLCLFSILCIAFVFIIKSRKRLRNFALCFLALFILSFGTIMLGGTRGFDRIKNTFKIGTAPMQEDRYDIYKHLPDMIADHTLWGVGPGAFSTVYFFHRGPQRTGIQSDDSVGWSAWAHSDPLEILITFGVVGTILIAILSLIIVVFSLQTFRFRRDDNSLEILSIGMCTFLIHSCFDFPFQVYSLSHLFIVTLALFSVQWHPFPHTKTYEEREK